MGGESEENLKGGNDGPSVKGNFCEGDNSDEYCHHY